MTRSLALPALHDETGSVAVETAIIAPALVFLLLLVVFAGKVSEAEGNVARAASEAARAASLRQHPGGAAEDAERVAKENLTASGVPCIALEVRLDISDFGPGGTVRVDLRCVASMSDVASLGVPGQRTFSATAVEVIDTFRSGP